MSLNQSYTATPNKGNGSFYGASVQSGSSQPKFRKITSRWDNQCAKEVNFLSNKFIYFLKKRMFYLDKEVIQMES